MSNLVLVAHIIDVSVYFSQLLYCSTVVYILVSIRPSLVYIIPGEMINLSYSIISFHTSLGIFLADVTPFVLCFSNTKS